MTAIGMGVGIPFNQQGFNPFAVGQPIVLLDAAMGITIETGVSIWADQSGNSNDISQATPGDQPLFNASDSNFNNQPSITFDGVSEFLNRSTFTGGALSQPNTIFLLKKVSVSTGTQIYIDGQGAARHAIFQAGSVYRVFAGANYISDLATDTNTNIITSLGNGASSNLWKNGVPAGSTGNAGTVSMNGLVVGADITPANFFAGEIAYCLIYNFNLSDTAKNYIGNGLAARFGTTWTDI